MPTRIPLALLLTVLAAAPAAAQENLPRPVVSRLEVQPASITLTTAYQYRQLLVTGVLESGERIDLTGLAKVEAPVQLVKVSDTQLVRPTADGTGTLTISYDGKTATIPVKVAGLKDKYEVNFVSDVMPILSRMGCNAGTCHGAAEGKNGFKLSLRGYDPLADHRSLTDDLEGRRFNRVDPDKSLMLLKTSGSIPHVGGVVTQPGQPYYELLRTWIGQGVKLDINSKRVSRIEMQPRSVSVPLPKMKQQMAVVATFSDGTIRDVTCEAFIESSNTEVATADRNGTVTAVRRGEATVMARYEGDVHGQHALRDGRPQRLCLEAGRGVWPHRLPGLREAQTDQGAAQQPLHRCGVRSPDLPRPDWPAASARTGACLPGRS